MKKIISSFIITFLFLYGSAADIYVNNSGQPGSYTTITAALAAAAPNDNVYVSPYGAYTENLTIFQNVTLTSAVSGTVFNVVGTLTINGAPNMDVRIIGAEFSGSFTANTGGAGLNTKSDVYVVESVFSAITAADFIRMHVLFCDADMNISMRHGEIRGNSNLGDVTIADGPNAGVGDTLFIVGNSFKTNKKLYWNNDDNYFFIANNYIYTTSSTYRAFRNSKHHYNSTVNNLVLNNIFSVSTQSSSNYTAFYSNSTSNADNVICYNNVFENRYNSNGSYLRCFYCSSPGDTQLYYNYCKGASTGTTPGGLKVVGNISYNYTTANLVYENDGTCNDPKLVNQGSPSLQYYDIDLTRNDIGTFGGPWSIKNYASDSSSIGKARVYDLDMPFEIWSGQTPSVKAKGAHTK
jgi:hypothetical protein